MAILKEKVNLVEGSTVTHELINDTVETSVEAYKKSAEAHSQAELALKKSSDAESHVARGERKIAEMQQIVDDVEQKAKSGKFDGRNAVLVPASGMFGFKVENGELILVYSGDEAPNFSVNDKGELIFNF